MEGCCQGGGTASASVDSTGRGRSQDVATVITLIFAGQLSRCRMTVSRHRGVHRTSWDVGRSHTGAHEGSRQSLPAPSNWLVHPPLRRWPPRSSPCARPNRCTESRDVASWSWADLHVCSSTQDEFRPL